MHVHPTCNVTFVLRFLIVPFLGKHHIPLTKNKKNTYRVYILTHMFLSLLKVHGARNTIRIPHVHVG